MNSSELPDGGRRERPEGMTVLILSPLSANLAAAGSALKAVGIPIVRASNATEAIQSLREKTIDLLLVDTAMTRPGIVDLLAKVREVMPRIARAAFEVSPADQLDFRDLINRAQPCAFFTGAPSADRIREVLRRWRTETAAAFSSSTTAVPHPTAPVSVPTAAPTPRSDTFGAMALLRIPVFPKSVERPAPKPALPSVEPKRDAPAQPGLAKTTRTGGTGDTGATNSDSMDGMLQIVTHLLEEPEIQLPVLPQIAREVRKELAREDASSEKIAAIVALDPSMSAKILAVANSPLYAGVEKIRNLQHAVSRIGMRETRNILQAVATKHLFAAQDSRLAALMNRLWMHSLACAYSNEIVAKDLRIRESADFFMMGLLHDIGKLLIIHLIQIGYERKLWAKKDVNDSMIADLFLRGHNNLGKRLMEKWGYDESFQDVVFLHNDGFSKVRSYSEPVVVTFYSDLLTRRMDFSLLPYPDDTDPLGTHDIAQALNMTPGARERIEASLRDTLTKIQESYK